MSLFCSFKGCSSKEKQKEKTTKFKRLKYKSKKKLSYTLESVSKKSEERIFKLNNMTYPTYNWLKVSSYQINHPYNEKKITILKIDNEACSETPNSDKILIISHGFSKDLGNLLPEFFDISIMLKMTVVSYEYTEVNSSETQYDLKESLTLDLKTVINYSISKFNIEISDVILMSISLGSIPTISLASQEYYNRVNSVILINPISRGYCIFSPSVEGGTEREYDNRTEATKICAKTFIIHGKRDSLIDHTQSMQLRQFIKRVCSWFPNRGTHNNILTEFRKKFYIKLREFLENATLQKEDNECDLDNELDFGSASTKTSGISQNITRGNRSTLRTPTVMTNASLVNEYFKIIPCPQYPLTHSYVDQIMGGEDEYLNAEGKIQM